MIWSGKGSTAKQVVEALQRKRKWKPRTIQTLLRRLVDKGVLGYTKRGREYVFHPLVEAKACVRTASRSFISRVFDGELAPFLAFFLENEDLTDEEVEELRQILNHRRP